MFSLNVAHAAPAKCAEQPPSPVYDPYAGMKTPGQRQLISLQERVKVGEITVDEAVNEFKAWKFDQDGRASSIRYQQVGQYGGIHGVILIVTSRWSDMSCLCRFLFVSSFRKTWSSSEKASPGDTKRGRRQGRIVVGSPKCSRQVSLCVWMLLTV